MNSAAAQSLAEAHPPTPSAGVTSTSSPPPPPRPTTPATAAAQGLASISSPPPPSLPPAPIEPSPLAPSPDESSLRQQTPTPSTQLSFEHQHQHHQPPPPPPTQQHHHQHHPLAPSPQTHQVHHPHLQAASPPLRKDTNSSISTQATNATLASAESNNTSYSAETSPNPHQSIFSVKDGTDVSNNRRTSRRRTGPLSQQSRERAALIRKLGACGDCRRRRVACHPSHHNMTWEDVINKFSRAHSPSIQDIAPSIASGRPLSPAPLSHVQSLYTHDPQDMEIDSPAPTPQQPGRPPLSEARIRTPLPSGPRLEKSLSLPGIESLKNDLQTNVGRMLSTPSRDRYTAVQALLLFWQDDEDISNVQAAVNELAEVFDKFYHYSFQIQTIPSSSSDGCKSSWRWLSRQLNDFAEDRDQRDVLKIVYYVGHTYLDGNREMVLASTREKDTASIIRWSGIQQILEEACSDTLIIMDAAYYPSSTMIRQRGVLELIAASVSQEHFNALDRCSFTRALADLLRTRATRVTPLSAAELHTALFAQYAKLVQDKTPEKEMITSFPSPLHILMSGNSRLPSIYLAPVHLGSAMRPSISSYENSPQLHLSIRLNDDNVDTDIWNEWLRMMPDGVKDVKVDGPFRATFR